MPSNTVTCVSARLVDFADLVDRLLRLHVGSRCPGSDVFDRSVDSQTCIGHEGHEAEGAAMFSRAVRQPHVFLQMFEDFIFPGAPWAGERLPRDVRDGVDFESSLCIKPGAAAGAGKRLGSAVPHRVQLQDCLRPETLLTD